MGKLRVSLGRQYVKCLRGKQYTYAAISFCHLRCSAIVPNAIGIRHIFPGNYITKLNIVQILLAISFLIMYYFKKVIQIQKYKIINRNKYKTKKLYEKLRLPP